MFENIIYTPAGEDSCAVIMINRPKAYNALNMQVNHELLEAIEMVRKDPACRALILSGNDKAFAAGADIKEMSDADSTQARERTNDGRAVNRALEALEIPTIAAVSGFALGGGCELAASCDFRVVEPRTTYGLPETTLGIIPGAGGTQRLIPLIGLARTRRMVILNEKVKGEEAVKIGLADFLAEDGDVMSLARKIAAKLTAHPVNSLRQAKKAINEGVKNTLEEGLKQEENGFISLFETYDQKEGMKAMLEKRRPEFQNR